MHAPPEPPRRAAAARAALLALCLLALSLAGCDRAPRGERAGPPPVEPAAPARVLFIGNSLTYYHNLPRVFERLAPPGRALEVAMVAGPGFTLRDHWERGEALRTLRESRWGYVVLQEQSALGETWLVDGRPRVHDPGLFYDYARRFDAEIRKAGARTVLYLHWPRREAPARDGRALEHAFFRVGRELGALVAPAGPAWAEAGRAHPAINLYDDDGLHPSPAGAYLAASAIYATIFDGAPQADVARVVGHPVTDPSTGAIDAGREASLVDLPRE